MYCPKCGKEISSGDAFCSKCGWSLDSRPREPEKADPAVSAPEPQAASDTRSAFVQFLSPQGDSSYAVAALWLGVASVACCCSICSVPAVIFGAIGLNDIAKHPEKTGRERAWAGIILGGISILLSIAGILVNFLQINNR